MDYNSLLDKIPGAITIISKAYSFFKNKWGEKEAKQIISFAYQECLKVNPDMKFIKQILAQYEGTKKLQAEINEVKDVKKKIGSLTCPKVKAGLKLASTAKLIRKPPRKVVSIKGSKVYVK